MNVGEQLEEARVRWLKEEVQYASFGSVLEGLLRRAVQGIGIWARVDSRAKELDSLIKKMVRGDRTYESIGDKAGVRVVVRYKADVDKVLEAAAEVAECQAVERKGDSMEPNEVGYLCAHADVSLRADDGNAAQYPPNIFRAELQVRTLAQHMWAEMSHDTLYKNEPAVNPLSSQTKRRIFILAGVIELADDEFDRLNRDTAPSDSAAVLRALQRHYYKFTSHPWDAEISLRIIRLFIPEYHEENIQAVINHLDEFCAGEESALNAIYVAANGNPNRSAFLYQPEALLLYDRLKADEIGTRKIWNQWFPERELERVALDFGIPFD